MHPQKFDAVTRMAPRERYLYFIRKVCDFEAIWSLHNGGWATGQIDGKTAIPIWPEPEFADGCAGDDWRTYSAKKISLDDFLTRWIPGAEASGYQFAVFPTVNDKAVAVESAKLGKDLREELSSYE